MSGHSKWSQIKHKKAVVDAKRSKEFSKLARLITVESRLCGGDTSSPSLKTIVDKAKAANMPKENIERAVQKGAGGGDVSLEHVAYELYGPGGVAIIITATTDSKNRTVQELKHLLSELGYTLAEPGSAQWAFTVVGGVWTPSITLPLSEADHELLQELVASLYEHDDVEEVFTNATQDSPLT
jgi:YebC/PmpR family DNA-binding regulatory protein